MVDTCTAAPTLADINSYAAAPTSDDIENCPDGPLFEERAIRCPAAPTFGASAPPPTSTNGGQLPVLCCAGETFDAWEAAERCMSAPGSMGVPSHLRKLLWLRWLDVIQGDCPSNWLQEVRTFRSEFEELELQVQKRMNCDPHMEQLCTDVDMDILRCFPELQEMQTEAARGAIRRILLAYAERHRQPDVGCHAYRQGFHELAAAMLVVCTDGCWPGGAVQGLESDVAVYTELGATKSVPADAFALLDALLHKSHVVDMYEPRSDGDAALVKRCRGILGAVHRVDPGLGHVIDSWGLSPHVLLLRWLRLLFLREMSFPHPILVTWDKLFSDAAIRASPQFSNRSATPASDAMPLADYLACAMIMKAKPSSPDQLLQFEVESCDVDTLIELALNLRHCARAGRVLSERHLRSGKHHSAASTPDSKSPKSEEIRLNTEHMQESSSTDGWDSNAIGDALGWAATVLEDAYNGMFGVEGTQQENSVVQAPMGPTSDRVTTADAATGSSSAVR